MANHPGRAPRAPMVGAKADLKPLGRVIRMLFQDYPAMLIAVMVCIIISAIVGILPAIYIETITSYIEDGLRLGWDGVSGKILHALVTMVCIYLVGLACTAVYTQLMAHVTQGFLHKLRTRMFAGMQKLPIRYFDQNSRGDIMSYYTNDIDTLRQLVSQSLPQLFAAGLTVLGLLLFMFFFSIPLMLIVFLGIFCMTKVTKNVGGRSAKYFLSQQKSLGKVEGYIEEMMNGQKSSRSSAMRKRRNAILMPSTTSCSATPTMPSATRIFSCPSWATSAISSMCSRRSSAAFSSARAEASRICPSRTCLRQAACLHR